VQALQATIGWQNMLLQLDKCSLRQIAPDEVTLIEKSLTPAQSTDDARLAALMLAMRQEVRDGCPSGRLYAESISLALLAYLAGAYANQRQVETRTAALTPTQKRRLVDYIRANLASNISVAEIAGLVQMSPSHFARVFKASFGVAPYQYVLWERIETAKGMLVDTKLSGSHVAMALGFASQSHFAKVFRQFTGVTPKQYQAGL
jgi:AraC family transcriptional regulator